MIKLHRLNGQEVIVNAELIENLEALPDTAVVLYTGNRYIVKETPAEIQRLVVEYKRSVYIPKTNPDK